MPDARRRPSAVPLLTLSLDAQAAAPLFRQVFEGVQAAILAGRLGPGTRLPPSRALARELGVSRNTVLQAYELLMAEGYVDARVGSGTRVSATLPETALHASPAGDAAGRHSDVPAAPLSRLARAVPPRPEPPHPWRAFRLGVPEVKRFPFDDWARGLARVWRNPPADLLFPADVQGHRPLREAIAAYLGAHRGVRCNAGDVIVTAGGQQGIDLASRVLVDPGDAVCVEDPGYAGHTAALAAAGADVRPVPVDDGGFDVAAAETVAPAARLAVVTPSRQYPLGTVMPLARRLELLGWARQAGAWIVEDDYDSEYRFTGKPLTALQGLDPEGRVIYLGTFSKVLFPGLRVGYLVVPPALRETFVRVRRVLDDRPPSVVQPVLAEFMASGAFAGHLRRMRGLYAARQEVMRAAVRRHLGADWSAPAEETGMHLIVRRGDGAAFDDKAVERQLASAGVVAPALSGFYADDRGDRGFALGYAGFEEAEIDAGMAVLAAALRSLRTSSRPPAS